MNFNDQMTFEGKYFSGLLKESNTKSRTEDKYFIQYFHRTGAEVKNAEDLQELQDEVSKILQKLAELNTRNK